MSKKKHFDGTWGCGDNSTGMVKSWDLVNCYGCLNTRENMEMSALVGYSDFVLNGSDLDLLFSASDRRDPAMKKFKKINYSSEMQANVKKMMLISKTTSQLGTVTERFDYVMRQPKSWVRHIIELTMKAWFSSQGFKETQREQK